MFLYLVICLCFFSLHLATALNLKLGYYSNVNLPCGMEARVTGELPLTTGENQKLDKSMNFTINPNTQFTTIFNAELDDLNDNQTVQIGVYDQLYVIRGRWVPLNFSIDLPSYDESGEKILAN